MSPRPPRPLSDHQRQLDLPTPTPAKARAHAAQPDPQQAAKVAIARRAKRSAVPGYVKLVLTLELRRTLAERLSARAIRGGKNLEAVVIELLAEGLK